jgi:hypothetical protein
MAETRPTMRTSSTRPGGVAINVHPAVWPEPDPQIAATIAVPVPGLVMLAAVLDFAVSR